MLVVAYDFKDDFFHAHKIYLRLCEFQCIFRPCELQLF